MKHKCPLCNGIGKVEMVLVLKPKKGELRKAAERMKKKGYTIRDIAQALGFKNPGSISHLLNKK